MKKNEAIKLVDEKVNELKATIASLKTNEVLSKATRGTQLYARGKERRVLTLISTLLNQCQDNVALSEKDMDTFVLITTLTSERKPAGVIECEVGEAVFTVAQRYPNKSLDKIMKALEKQGLTIDGKGIIVASGKEE